MYKTDWKNIDLNSPCERGLTIIDSLTFETLLLEIHCNLQEINEKTVTEQFEKDLNSRIKTAREIFNANLKNIVKYANKRQKEC